MNIMQQFILFVYITTMAFVRFIEDILEVMLRRLK